MNLSEGLQVHARSGVAAGGGLAAGGRQDAI